MDKFLDSLDTEFLPDGYHWRLLEPVIMDDDVLGRITVPIGFVTDLGSIPRIFWNILPPIGPASEAFVIHDFLYATQPCTRYQADMVLLRAMSVLDVNLFAQYLIFAGVRVGGWWAWAQDGKAKEAKK